MRPKKMSSSKGDRKVLAYQQAQANLGQAAFVFEAKSSNHAQIAICFLVLLATISDVYCDITLQKKATPQKLNTITSNPLSFWSNPANSGFIESLKATIQPPSVAAPTALAECSEFPQLNYPC